MNNLDKGLYVERMVTFSLLKISKLLPTNQRKMVEFNFEFNLKDFVPNKCLLQIPWIQLGRYLLIMLVKSIAKIFYKIIMTKSLGDLLAYIISNCFMNACTAKLRPKTM